jgi:two-component system, chemotaxis family, chemotaxis protein CheY
MTGAGELVLLVEDDDDLRELEATILARAGYRVMTAREGGEALDRVAVEMPRVIFLDMRMPGMDGWTFAREFRARHDHATPLVVVTAEACARTRAEEIGADGVLGKPFDATALMRAAQEHVGAEAAAP